VATYLSMHIIACMTRQALNELMATLQRARDITLIRASASQMAGRLLCEFEAPDQDTLLRFLEAHNVTYEWIIRVEMSWGGGRAEKASAQADSAPVTSAAVAAAQEAMSETTPPLAVASPAAVASAVEPASASPAVEEAGTAAILHILRNLKDESAWQIIEAQRLSRPVAVLLMHDAVLAPPPLDVPLYACAADVQARGIGSALPQLTYDQIVELIFASERVMVW
jgi:sulfur transfer complex TusBCD TusB component (DsrH family)